MSCSGNKCTKKYSAFSYTPQNTNIDFESFMQERTYSGQTPCTYTCSTNFADCDNTSDLDQDCVAECGCEVPFPGIESPRGCNDDPCLVPYVPPDNKEPDPPDCKCNPCPSNPYAPCPPDLCDPANCVCGQSPPEPCSCPPSPYDPCPANPCPGCVCDQCPPEPCPPDPCSVVIASRKSELTKEDITKLELFLEQLKKEDIK